MDLNVVTEQMMQAIRGIGPRRAESIVRVRQRHPEGIPMWALMEELKMSYANITRWMEEEGVARLTDMDPMRPESRGVTPNSLPLSNALESRTNTPDSIAMSNDLEGPSPEPTAPASQQTPEQNLSVNGQGAIPKRIESNINVEQQRGRNNALNLAGTLHQLNQPLENPHLQPIRPEYQLQTEARLQQVRQDFERTCRIREEEWARQKEDDRLERLEYQKRQQAEREAIAQEYREREINQTNLQERINRENTRLQEQIAAQQLQLEELRHREQAEAIVRESNERNQDRRAALLREREEQVRAAEIQQRQILQQQQAEYMQRKEENDMIVRERARDRQIQEDNMRELEDRLRLEREREDQQKRIRQLPRPVVGGPQILVTADSSFDLYNQCGPRVHSSPIKNANFQCGLS